MGPIQKTMEAKLRDALAPDHLELINESGSHNVPPGSESHFKATIVSHAFEGQSLIDRHREVNRVLSEELAGLIHALSLRTLTPDEWRTANETPHETPPCLGGSKQ